MLLSNNNIFITQQDRENNTSQYILEAINIGAHNIITKPDITGSYSLRQNDSDVVNYSKCT